MKRLVNFIVLFALLASVFAVPALAQDGGPIEPLTPAPEADASAANETPELWFVEMASPPLADGTRPATIAREKNNFREEAKQVNLQYTEVRSFSTLWNGMSISVSASELPKLYRMQSVKAVYPVFTVSIPEVTASSDPDLATALAMTGADIAQSELGYTGAGVRVAVMDTGIDYDHPDLGGCFGPGCRVAFGWDFVGDDFNADPTSPFYNPVPSPDPDPDDCNGHGTHVAGIVGANGAVVGVAPEVTFGAYRVFGCGGSTTADIMIAAMERAFKDRMQVLNMSIGSAFTWPQYPTAQASDRLVNRGMVVVASIGNSGASGVYSAGAPGLGEKVIGVASFDNTHVELNIFTISPDDTEIGYGVAAAAPAPPISGTFPMTRTGTVTSSADACSPLSGDLSGHIALIRRGGCTFHTKALNAQNAGAIGVVLYNNVPGRFSPTVAGSPPITIPVVAISDVEGALIDSRLATGPVDLTWTDMTGLFLNPTGGLISSFSSYGLAPDLSLKPDIGAPGGSIRSTFPLELGGYATLSGTSMSSPHVAGGVALLLQAKPHTPAHVVRSILQNSADPANWWGNPALGFLDNVHRQGAGMLDIDDSILAKTRVEPAKIAVGESEAGATVHTLTLTNYSRDPVTYDLSYVNALSTGGSTFAPSFFLSDAVVTFSSSSVTVPGNGTASVDVTIHPATAPDKGQYGGYIVFTPSGSESSEQSFSVPFAGFVGDYQSITALAPTVFGFPWLAKLENGSFFNQPGGGTFTMTGDDLAYFLVHFDHQAQRVRAQVHDAHTNALLGRAFSVNFMPRNSGPNSFFAFAWDGVTQSGTVLPDGDYVVVLSVLKALGDPNNPAHWETWTSPVVTIDRP